MSKKFLLIYRSQLAAAQAPMSGAEVQAVLEKWGQWKAKFPAILDMGDGLLPTGKRIKQATVTDGPAVESKEIVSGYSILGANDYDDAVKVAKECPILLAPGNSVEIRELAGY